MGHGRRLTVLLVLIGAVFIAYGIYALSASRASPQLLGILTALVSVIGGVGIVLNQRWSKYCVYVVSALLSGTWLYYAALAVLSAPLSQIVIALLPGLFIVVIAAGSSYVVTRHFRAVEE
jgi:drug/metabolite transporter (DMT)-like permease